MVRARNARGLDALSADPGPPEARGKEDPAALRSRASPTRPRMIGVFTAELDDAYQIEVWRGIEARAHERGVGVVCFLGSRVDSVNVSEAAANVAYRIADRRSIDGLVVVTSAIATFLDAEGLTRLFARGEGFPQVSVGVKIAGVASLSVDGSAGLAEVVRHLVRHHGRRHFALLGGPPGHPESEERVRAVRRALGEAGTPFDPRLEVQGSFLQESGIEAARRLKASGVPFDALVCLNDRMALGAMSELRKIGIRVPEEVSVVGFDGIEEGQYVTPPLTTVVQPLRELGSSALDALLDVCDGKEPRDRTLSCALAIRQSCGCPPARSYDPDLEHLPADATAEELLAIEELTERGRRNDSGGFIVRLNAALAAAEPEVRLSTRWNGFLSLIARRAGAEGAPLLEFARVLVGETETRFQAARRTSAEERFATLREISASLAGSFDMPVTLARLEAGLDRLGIGGGYLALFERRGRSEEWSRLVMVPRDTGVVALSAKGLRFHTSNLVPPAAGGAWRQGSWILEPLVFQNEPLGYIMLAGGADELSVYDTLRDQVASAVKGALLLEQVHTHEHRLEVEVKRRTAELTEANAELTREIERRVRLEEEVVDISNRTMQRIGQDIHDDLCQYLAGIAMLATALRGDLAEVDGGALSSIDRIGTLLADSIVRAKQIARGLFPTGLEEHGLSAAIEEMVAVARQRFHATIDFRASPDFALPDTDQALQVYRIVQEALSNALKHSESNRVEVRLYRELLPKSEGGESEAVLVAEVVDYGVGLSVDVPDHGMGLRIMRYRAEKAGVDLRIESLDPGTRVCCRLDQAQGAVR